MSWTTYPREIMQGMRIAGSTGKTGGSVSAFMCIRASG